MMPGRHEPSLNAAMNEALARLATSLVGTLSLQPALETTLATAAATLGADSGSLCLVNPTSGFLEIEAMRGFPEPASRLRLRLGEGLTGWVARNGRPIRIGDVTADSRYVALRPGVRSELAVPILLQEEVRGVINLDADRPDAFDAVGEHFLALTAQLVAPLIESCWQHESVRQKTRLLESLVRVGQIINSPLHRDDTLTAIAREARTLMGARMCSLLLVDESREWLDLVAHHGAGPAYVRKPRLPLAESLLGIVVRRRKPVQVPDVQTSGRYQHVSIARKEGLVSLLAVPLLDQDRAIGTLNVYKERPHIFSDEEIRTLAAYAELSGFALGKAQLYDRLIRLEDELRGSERLNTLGLLAAEIAHEIRNPLTVMKMLHHSLAVGDSTEPARNTDIRILGDKIDHLNRIVDRVLDIARRTEPTPAPVDVNLLLQDLALLIRGKARAQDVELLLRLDAALPACLADATQLEQAFLNLILNAIDAMPQGGRLTLHTRSIPLRDPRPPSSAAARPSHIAIRFRDTGIGMSREQQQRAFTSLLNTSKPRGTGLGLAIVARIVEQHAGRIRLHSTPGRGAAFTLFLPVDQTGTVRTGA